MCRVPLLHRCQSIDASGSGPGSRRRSRLTLVARASSSLVSLALIASFAGCATSGSHSRVPSSRPAVKPLSQRLGSVFKLSNLLGARPQWLHRHDAKKRDWAAGGRTGLAEGVEEFYFRTPDRLGMPSQWALLLDLMRELGPAALPERKLGWAFQFDDGRGLNETFQFLDLSRMAPGAREKLRITGAQERVLDTFLDFVVRKGYGGEEGRMTLTPEQQEKLISISGSVRDRTFLFLKTADPYVWFNRDTKTMVFRREGMPGREPPAELRIQGGTAAVVSSGESELLPLELLTGYRIERKPGEKIAEVGRYFVPRAEARSKTSAWLNLLYGALLHHYAGVQRVFIEVEAARASVFAPLGYEIVHSRTNLEGKLEHVMEVQASRLFELASERILAELPRELAELGFTEARDVFSHPYFLAQIAAGKDGELTAGHDPELLAQRVLDARSSEAWPEERAVPELARGLGPVFRKLSTAQKEELVREVWSAYPEVPRMLAAIRRTVERQGFSELARNLVPDNPFFAIAEDLEAIRALPGLTREQKRARVIERLDQSSDAIYNLGSPGMELTAEWLTDPGRAGMPAYDLMLEAKIATHPWKRLEPADPDAP